MSLMMISLIVQRKSPNTSSLFFSHLTVTIEIRLAPVPFFIKPITSTIASRVNSSFLDANFKTHFGFLESTLQTSGGD